MHMPERWGYMYLSGNTVGAQDEMKYPHDMNVYKNMWAVFYAQQDSFNETKKYKTLAELGLANAGLTFESTSSSYQIKAEVPAEGVVYILNNEGRFWKESK